MEPCQDAGERDRSQPRGPPLRVLIVDDDRDTVGTLALLLRLWGHEALGARSGPEALAVASSFRPDVMLLDVAMPGMSGFDLVRRIRAEPQFEDTLVIALTGYADEKHRRLGAEAGFSLYLAKPVEPAVVRELLQGEKARLARPSARNGVAAHPYVTGDTNVST